MALNTSLYSYMLLVILFGMYTQVKRIIDLSYIERTKQIRAFSASTYMLLYHNVFLNKNCTPSINSSCSLMPLLANT